MSDVSPITFSFGKNWQSFIKNVSPEAVAMAVEDTKVWLPQIQGLEIVDIGCGSGLSSLAFHLRGAGRIVSFDVDPHSVAATTGVWTQAGKPESWRVTPGSILDPAFLAPLKGQFDIAYSWGVLHHTGQMWTAIGNACEMVKPGGRLWLALYAKGPRYPNDLALKKRYNAAGRLGKWLIERREIWRLMKQCTREHRNPFRWNQRRERGMDLWHDILDWLGGLPYEVVTVQELLDFARARGFAALKVHESQEGGNHIVLLERSAGLPAAAPGSAS